MLRRLLRKLAALFVPDAPVLITVLLATTADWEAAHHSPPEAVRAALPFAFIALLAVVFGVALLRSARHR